MLKKIASKIYDWVDERTEISTLLSKALNESIPGGSSYAYTFGSVLIFLFILQILTGMFLTMYYVPSAEDAHSTVEYISKVVTFGWLIRGIHHYGSSAMVITVVFHILQTIFWGAYKGKRELVWFVGVILLQLVLLFSLTGYLLPWDMKAYFGTTVTVNIASEVPLVGELLRKIILGGNTLGTITLSRFFMIHAFLLPMLTISGVLTHVYLFRKAKPAGSFKPKNYSEVFYPKQLFKDALVILLVFCLIVCLTNYYPASLEPKADPNNINYIARPEWYFLSLFQLLKYFQGPFAIVGSIVIPGVLILLLAVLPFIDKSKERHPLKRPIVLGCTLVVLITIGVLMYLAKMDDKVKYAEQFANQKRSADKFLLEEPFVPKQVSKIMSVNIPPPDGFKAYCTDCHGDQAQGGAIGPNLIGIKRSKDQIIDLIENPSKYGVKRMPPIIGLSVEERIKIAEWIKSRS